LLRGRVLAKDGFLAHRRRRPRFWEPSTSRGENLSAEREVVARTEFDRYARGEEIVVALMR